MRNEQQTHLDSRRDAMLASLTRMLASLTRMLASLTRMPASVVQIFASVVQIFTSSSLNTISFSGVSLWRRIQCVSTALLFLTLPFTSFSQEFPARSNRLVNDYSNTLSSSELNGLEELLVRYDRESSVQIAIVLIKTLDGYPIDDYAFQLGEKWGIGQGNTNNGALVLVSMDEREMWIATGYGLEATLTDAMSKRIIENEMKPHFQKNDFAGGLAAASNAIIEVTRGEYQGKGGGHEADGAPIEAFLLILLVFGIIWLMKAKQVRDYSRVNNIGFWAAWMLLASASRSHGGSYSSFSGGSGGFSGRGGGGFGGFGGGSFGGGGAGGSW